MSRTAAAFRSAAASLTTGQASDCAQFEPHCHALPADYVVASAARD